MKTNLIRLISALLCCTYVHAFTCPVLSDIKNTGFTTVFTLNPANPLVYQAIQLGSDSEQIWLFGLGPIEATSEAAALESLGIILIGMSQEAIIKKIFDFPVCFYPVEIPYLTAWAIAFTKLPQPAPTPTSAS